MCKQNRFLAPKISHVYFSGTATIRFPSNQSLNFSVLNSVKQETMRQIKISFSQMRNDNLDNTCFIIREQKLDTLV